MIKSLERTIVTTTLILVFPILFISHKEYKNTISNLYAEIDNLNVRVEKYQSIYTHHLRLSAYTANKDECDSDPNITASMQRPISGWTVAVSRDLVGWLGKRVYIEGFGVRLVNDLMAARHTGAIDILVPNVASAREIGIRPNVKVVLIGY